EAAEFKRIGKGGVEVWIQASYNPVFDPTGKPFKVVKFATNITDRKRDEGILDQLKQSFDRIAKGDMSGLITTPFTGRYEELRQAFNLSVENVTTIIGQVKDTSRALKMATGEILSGANDLSQRTTRQAATIEETSATMEQLSRMVV